jgi:hypothetical protein
MFLMSYGYNPTNARSGEPTPPTAKVVDGIVFSSAVHNNGEPNRNTVRRYSVIGKLNRPSKIPTHYLKTIEKRIEIINDGLLKRNAPYKFELRSEDKKILIDLMIKNGDDTFTRWHTQEVTQSNFGSLLDKMSSGEGFIFDD